MAASQARRARDAGCRAADILALLHDMAASQARRARDAGCRAADFESCRLLQLSLKLCIFYVKPSSSRNCMLTVIVSQVQVQ